MFFVFHKNVKIFDKDKKGHMFHKGLVTEVGENVQNTWIFQKLCEDRSITQLKSETIINPQGKNNKIDENQLPENEQDEQNEDGEGNKNTGGKNSPKTPKK